MVSCSSLKVQSLSTSKVCIFVQSVDYHFLSGVGFFVFLSWIIEVLGADSPKMLKRCHTETICENAACKQPPEQFKKL